MSDESGGCGFVVFFVACVVSTRYMPLTERALIGLVVLFSIVNLFLLLAWEHTGRFDRDIEEQVLFATMAVYGALFAPVLVTYVTPVLSWGVSFFLSLITQLIIALLAIGLIKMRELTLGRIT